MKSVDVATRKNPDSLNGTKETHQSPKQEEALFFPVTIPGISGTKNTWKRERTWMFCGNLFPCRFVPPYRQDPTFFRQDRKVRPDCC